MLNNNILEEINNDIEKLIKIGEKSNIILKNQSEKLLYSSNKLEKIERDINISEKIINKLNNFSNTLISLFINRNEEKNIEKGLDNIKKNNNKIEEIKKNEEIDDMLNKAKILNRLSKEINEELTNHNNLLDNIDIKTEDIIIKINKIDKKINKIL